MQEIRHVIIAAPRYPAGQQQQIDRAQGQAERAAQGAGIIGRVAVGHLAAALQVERGGESMRVRTVNLVGTDPAQGGHGQ